MLTALNYINGKWSETSTGNTKENVNPGNVNEVVGSYQESDLHDLNQAVEAASKAKKAWKKLSGSNRGEYLYKVADIMEERSEEIALIASKEMGKTIAETRGETTRGIAILRYYAGEGMRKVGDVIPSTDASALMFTTRVPLGVVGVITPWNFPVAIPIWKMAPALIYGNTVVIKPASETALTCVKILECFDDANLPAGVINCVTGKGSVIGQGIAEHTKVNGITFTGSNSVGKQIGHTAFERGAKYQLEMGGKNPVIVANDADLNIAVEATISGAFKSTGQKCTATSRVFVGSEIYPAFKEQLVKRTNELLVGDSLAEGTWMGPCASKSQLATCLEYINKGIEEGAELIAGGNQIHHDKGYFIEPTIFECTDHSQTIAQEEIFGPVIALFKVESVNEALKLANDVEYGLSASIFTTNISEMLTFVEDIEAGLLRINAESAGVELQAPFGGVKQSSSHSREQGEAAKEFFTSIKTVFLK
ncbi:alpha-ketoglutaric semialdehyde dehydrogenase GucD [Shouchella patagoniensis]|uniref:alpha-ketoglutaric semialdehyde dehydrogenase GucD n=1 Tax=Shouchella patagoniensis TaxID=228576 RepID=UPI0009955E00|nr:alpha-ketoglutaric semialdehyde dehydrogenase GucD [Shouchella patagoniensis]